MLRFKMFSSEKMLSQSVVKALYKRCECLVVTQICSRSTSLPKILGRHSSSLSYKHHIGSSPLQYVTLGQALTKAAERWPERPAIISRHENRTLTYSQLVEEADRLAAALAERGMVPGDRLGIWSPNCTQWVVAIMAAARSGFISVAMNPLYQSKELEHCLRKVGVKTLLAQETINNDNYYEELNKVIPELPSSKKGYLNSSKLKDLKSVILVSDKDDIPGVITYNKLLEGVSETKSSNVGRNVNAISPDTACNIQFTSGTTGLPKAPILSHYNIVNNGFNVGRRNELCDQHKKICVQVPLFHVFGVVIAISAAIQHGATLVFPSAKYSTSANIEALLAEKCGIIYGTPTMHIDLVNEVRARGITDIKAELAVTGGSPVTPQLIHDMAKVLNIKRVKSVFGMTECTAVSFQSLPGEDIDRPLSFVGHLQDHLEAKVVDDNNNTVPYGTAGELLVRGYSTMQAYWGDDDKTKETLGNDGWLRTGDQLVLHEDGYGQIVGRLKDMIIRGGENIAPKEIEDVVSTHPDIVECQVFGVNDNRLGEEVCAAVRVKDGVEFNAHALNKHCLENLSKFKVPRIFKQVEMFPKTASGKVQKFKLRNMVESGQL